MNIARRTLLGRSSCLASVQAIGPAAADWRDEVPAFRIGILGGALASISSKRLPASTAWSSRR